MNAETYAELLAALKHAANYDEQRAEESHTYACQYLYSVAQDARGLLAKLETKQS